MGKSVEKSDLFTEKNGRGKKKTQMNKLVIKQKLLLGGRVEMNRNLKKVERKALESLLARAPPRERKTREILWPFQKEIV